MAYGWEFNSALAGVGKDLASALSQKWEEERKKKAFEDFQKGITEAHSQPITFGAPQTPIYGNLGMPPPQPIEYGQRTTKTQIPPSDPRFINSAMEFMQSSPSAAGTLNTFLKLREMGQPTFTQKEIPRGATLTTFKNMEGQPPEAVGTIEGQPYQPTHSTMDKKISSRVGQDGKMYNMMQTPQNEFYEVEAGDVTDKQAGKGAFGAGSKGASWKPIIDNYGNTTGYLDLNSQQTVMMKDLGLGDYIPGKETSTTKTMRETAPKVKHLVERIKPQIDLVKSQLGAIPGRWTDLMTGRIGADNPEYNKLRVNMGLLSTLLMRMHVGARGGERIMEKFDELLGLGHQSPENMQAALDEITDYANDLVIPQQSFPPSQPSGFPPTQEKKATHRFNPTTGKIEVIQ